MVSTNGRAQSPGHQGAPRFVKKKEKQQKHN